MSEASLNYFKTDRAHRRVAWRHGSTVVHQRTDDHRVWYEDRALWADDLFHVSAAGHERWAGITLAALADLLEDDSETG